MSENPTLTDGQDAGQESSGDVLQQIVDLGATVDTLLQAQSATPDGGSTGRVVVVDLDAEEMIDNLQNGIEALCAAISYLLDILTNLQVMVRVREQVTQQVGEHSEKGALDE